MTDGARDTSLASRRSDAAIARLARPQHDVVTLAQLRELGLSARAVRHRVAAGRLNRLHRGVYAVGTPAPMGRWMGAVLACGDGAVLSHRSAAGLWGLAAAPTRVDVAVPGSTGRALRGVRVHSAGGHAPDDATVRDGIPCTSLARTLLDIAVALDRRGLERAIDRAEELREFDLADVDRLLERCRGRWGSRRLADALGEWLGPAATRSEAEERLLALIDGAGLSRPRMNAWISLEEGGGYRPDFLWPERGLIVEVDGRTFHGRRAAFRHDRRRDRRLALAGYATVRYDAGELLDDGGGRRVVEEIGALLGEPRQARALARHRSPDARPLAAS